VSKRVIIGWGMELAGVALWLYGYFATGHPSVINWHDKSPWWISDWMPNIEAEIGMLLILTAMIPIYWPRRH
jgi:protein-S-isoprenylcysteine O-methyltransferase Ste14